MSHCNTETPYLLCIKLKAVPHYNSQRMSIIHIIVKT